jgi:glycerophosphoryl diester phosphodiesterase
MTTITGHRGARNLWPENSLTGFRNTLQLGVDAIEFDVHLTDAGELVVIHDATLDRTAEASGPVRALTPASRAKVRLKDTDETIPTLGEVLQLLATAGPDLHVEIKVDENRAPYPNIAQRVADQLKHFGVEGRAYLTSFDTSILEECRRHAQHIRRLVSVNAEWAQRQGGLRTFIGKVDGVVDIVAIQHELMDAQWDLVTAALPRERLCVWTVNDEDTIRHWLEQGVGHLTSDRPDLALALRAAATV